MSKNQERIEKLMQTGNTNFIYRKELDKACFQYDMAYNPPCLDFFGCNGPHYIRTLVARCI